ncbi:unnamed protein product [Bursaphelenchus xylophilus]|uniref:(pine wood nematode) hypothetical protein n=1 Tax=Bursaphelenchus xylophilus TaxID=6326 RepID=A0A1I7SBB3_BURXY|nr:unnamed protein product [Bursaphelenchus xylophilus]CAG9131981.1 unnamed protein product [Bursaphelenchus xylophilus]
MSREESRLSAQLSHLRVATRVRNEAEAILSELGIQKGEPIVVERPPHQQTGRPVRVRTNMFSIQMNKPVRVFRYDLTIQGQFGEGKTIDFTRRSSSDALASDRKQCCRMAFELLLAEQSDKGYPPKEYCVYDLQAILFSLKELPIQGHTIVEMDIPEQFRPHFAPCTRLHFLIKCVEQFKLTLRSTVDKPPSNLELQNYDLQQFLEILTSQHAMGANLEHITFESGRSYLLDPEKFGFTVKDCPELSRGAYLAIGCQKSVRIVQGPSVDDPRAVMVLESKKTPFHKVERVIDKARSAFPGFPAQEATYRGVKQLLQGLYVLPNHTPRMVPFQIRELSSSARDTTFSFEGREVSVQEYFMVRYQVELQFPDAPLVVGKGKGKENNLYYPMEVLEVCDNQRLTSSQLTPDQTVDIIKASSVPPSLLDRQIQANCRSLRLNTDQTLVNAEIKIKETPIEVNGQQLLGPKVGYAGNARVELDTKKGSWAHRIGKARYLIPATVGVWAIYFCTRNERDMNEANQHIFIRTFMEQCRNKGMSIDFPAEVAFLGPPREDEEPSSLRRRFIRAQGKAQFIVVITEKSDLYVHKHLKQLEQEFDIVTQNVTIATARNAVDNQKSRLTMENVVNKTNVKCGGLNHAIILPNSDELGKDDLFVGFGMNHPGGFVTTEERRRGPPSVVGYAANDLKHPCAFSGDYLFQESRRDEKISIIDMILKTVIDRYNKHRGKMPRRIIIYRNGCSEGQFTSVLKFEIPILKETLRRLKCDAQITMIVPNRQHNIRFYPPNSRPGDKPWDQNLEPGTAIDSVVVHPTFFEFYLLSHQARQGTAKAPRYTVIYDENHLSLGDAENMTYALCYGHQIVACTVGLPAPCYIADCYAERGRNIYNAHAQSRHLESVDQMELQEMTEKLSYAEKVIRNKRFNA